MGEHEGPKGVNIIHLLDHAIANGLYDPVIVVTPTFNGNGTASSWAEKKNELIPGIESKYATYANGDVSTESLKASHAYQAFAGFSMGSMTSSQSAMAHCIDIFGYIGSYSAGLQHTNLTEEALLDMVRSAGNSLYYWYNGNGFADMAHDDYLQTCFKMIEMGSDVFVDGINPCWVNLPPWHP